MIHNDQELEATQERIAYFSRLLAQLRLNAPPEEILALTGGYSAEIARMQDEIDQYKTANNMHLEYEKFVQDIYQTLHRAEGFDRIKVNHNVKILGKSGCKHQIDIYWYGPGTWVTL